MLSGKKLTCYSGLILGMLWHSFANCKHSFNFAVNSPGAPPYIYTDPKTNEFKGLIVDIIDNVVSQEALKVTYIDSHRYRTESFIYKGLIDGMLSSSDWITHPEKLISTINLIEHKSFLYSLSIFPEEFKLVDLQGSKVCTRQGYVYPILVNNPQLDKVERIDSSAQFAMLQMLLKNRCHFAIMNEHNAIKLLSSSAFKNSTIYKSAQPVHITNLAIFLRPNFTSLKETLDHVISRMKSDGSLDSSLKMHTQNTIYQ